MYIENNKILNYFRHWKNIVYQSKRALFVLKSLKKIIKNVYFHKSFVNKIKYFHMWTIKAEKLALALKEKEKQGQNMNGQLK